MSSERCLCEREKHLVGLSSSSELGGGILELAGRRVASVELGVGDGDEGTVGGHVALLDGGLLLARNVGLANGRGEGKELDGRHVVCVLFGVWLGEVGCCSVERRWGLWRKE